MSKKGLAALLCAGLLLTCPLSAQGADGVRLEKPKVDAREVTVRFDGGKKGDWYHFYLDDYFIGGRLVNSEVRAAAKVFRLPAGVRVKKDSALRIEMAGANRCYLADELKLGREEPTHSAGGALSATYPTTVRPGERVRPKIIVKDEEGREQDVSTGAIYSYKGPVVSGSFANGGFQVSPEAKSGDTVGVTVVLGAERLDVTLRVEGTAVDSSAPGADKGPGLAQGVLNMSRQSGAVNQEELVTVSVPAAIANAVSAKVLVRDKDNPRALIGARINNPALLLAGGETTLALHATAGGAASFSIFVYDAAGRQVEELPFGFLFGPNTLPPDRVRMTIGLKTLRVGQGFRVIDTAPFINKGRTFVPLRALAEAFGAKVEYRSGDQSILIQDGTRRLEMRIGDKSYRLNGQSKAVDTAPYLSTGGRTLVPVRFAAEGLGYRPEVFYDGGGLTKDILFKRAK